MSHERSSKTLDATTSTLAQTNPIEATTLAPSKKQGEHKIELKHTPMTNFST